MSQVDTPPDIAFEVVRTVNHRLQQHTTDIHEFSTGYIRKARIQYFICGFDKDIVSYSQDAVNLISLKGCYIIQAYIYIYTYIYTHIYMCAYICVYNILTHIYIY